MAIQIISDSDTIGSVVTKINTISSELGSRDNLYNRSDDIVSALSEFNSHIDSDITILTNRKNTLSNSFSSTQDSTLSITVQSRLDSLEEFAFSVGTVGKAKRAFEIVSSGGINTLSYDEQTGKISIYFLEPYRIHNLISFPGPTPFQLDGSFNDDPRAIEINSTRQFWVTTEYFADSGLVKDDFYITGTSYYLSVNTGEVVVNMPCPEAL
jgi:hypothetical protein